MVCGKRFVSLAVFAVLVLIPKHQSSANELSSCVNEFETELSNIEYRMMHPDAFKAIDEVKMEADAAVRKVCTENEENAIRKAERGCVESIECVAVAGYRVYKANQEVRESSDTEASKQKLNNVNRDAKKIIADAGILAYLRIAEAIEIAGNYSAQPLRESLQHVTKAGQISYSGLDVAKQLGTLGLGSGETAKERGLNASSKTVKLAGTACYFNLVKAAKIAFGGIDRSKPATPDDISSESAAVEKSSEASSAIEYVKNAAESARKMSEGSSQEAVEVVKKEIIAAMRRFTATIQKSQETLKAIQEMEDAKESESLKILLGEGTKQAQGEIAYDAAFAYQGMGMAAEKVGGERAVQLGKAMSSVEVARSAAYNALKYALFSVLQGLENGRTAAKSGNNAANETLQAGLSVALDSLKNAATMAFAILGS